MELIQICLGSALHDCVMQVDIKDINALIWLIRGNFM